MENLRKAGKFVLTAACTLIFLLIVAGKLTDGISRGMGIGIVIFSILSGLAAAFYKDEDEGKEEGKQ
jgi:hypothetical protein